MMRRATVLLLTLMLALTVRAQEQPAPVPADYSRDKLIQIFSNEPVKGKVEPRIEWGFGFINFKALGMRWKIGYLPIMVPLNGSIAWRSNGAFGALPDPFILTNTQIASPPRTWKRGREMNAELKRIERLDRERAKITVNPE